MVNTSKIKMNTGSLKVNTLEHRNRKSEHTLLGARVVRTLNFYYVFTTFGVHDMPTYAEIGRYCVDIKIKNKCRKPA